MAYDEGLVERIRMVLADRADVSERKMFGGLSFMLRGNMCCGVTQDDLMVRRRIRCLRRSAGAASRSTDGLYRPPDEGQVFVGSEGYESDDDLAAWVERGVAYAQSLPAK